MDIKTLVLALALGNLSLCAALFFFEYERKKSLSMSTWAVAKHCQAVAWCLLYFRGVLPDFLSILLGNSLLFAGMALDAGALWQAAGRSGWRRFVLPALGLSVALFATCYVFDVAPLLRSAGGSLIVAGFFLAGVAALCLKWREASMLRRFLVVSMGILSLLIAARGVLAATVPGFDAELMQLAGFGALYLMMLTNAFGYLLLSREKLGSELARLEVIDAATGVPNRRGFYQALAPWMALARRPGLPTALRIRAAVEALPVKTERAVLQLTASLGVTTIRAEDSTVSLFKRADEALQAAKQAGRNQVAEAPGASTLDVASRPGSQRRSGAFIGSTLSHSLLGRIFSSRGATGGAGGRLSCHREAAGAGGVAQFASTCCAGAVPGCAAGVASRAWAAAHSKLPAMANNTVRATALPAEIMLAPCSMPGRRAPQYDGVREQKDKKIATASKQVMLWGGRLPLRAVRTAPLFLTLARPMMKSLKSLPVWPLAAPLAGWLFLFGASFNFGGFYQILLVAGLIGSVLAAVYHAEVVAHRIGEPYGTLVLALAVTLIEVALIVSLMLAGGPETTGLARDTVFAAIMIILNGIVGICLLLGAGRHREQSFGLLGVSASLATLAAIAILTLVLPNYTSSAAGPYYNSSQLIFIAVISL
eukprot:gene22081-26508_t